MNPQQRKSKKLQLSNTYGCYCWWCDQKLSLNQLTIDHLVPRSRGGSNSLENLRLTCFPCNNKRGNSLYPPSSKLVMSK